MTKHRWKEHGMVENLLCLCGFSALKCFTATALSPLAQKSVAA
jgi:hypothetical protein